MARRLLIGAAAVIVIGAIVGRLAHGPFWLSGEAQVSPAEPTDGPGIDFDGDGKVAPWETIQADVWMEDEGLAKLLEIAVANGVPLAGGDVDVSGYLRSIERPWPPEGLATLTYTACSDHDWMCCFVRGDTNRDWRLNGADISYLTNYFYLAGPAPENRDSGDTNDDGAMDSSDYIYLSNYLYLGGPEPPPPLATSGIDPTYDTMELPCQDRGDFEHDRSPLETSEIVLPPTEDPGLPKDMVPSDPTEPIDGTGGFGGISPALPVFPAPAGLAWGFRPSYRTRYAERGNEAQPFVLETEAGKGWFTGIPHVVDAGTAASPRYWVRWSASCVRGYVFAAPGVYTGRFTNQTTLIDDAGSNELRLYDLSGKTYVFYGYGASAGAAKGRIKRIEGLGGFTITQFERPRIEFDWDIDDTGEILSATVRCPLETTQALVTSQVWSFEHGGIPAERRIQSVQLERPTLPANIRLPFRVALRHWYAGLAEAGGTDGDLMQVDVTTDLTATSDQAEPGTVTRSHYYRYYTSDVWDDESSPGYLHQVAYAIGPDAVKDLDAATYKTADVSALADSAYTYCEDRRLRTLKVRGLSCGGCGGQGSYTYGWSLEKAQSVGQPNESHLRVHIELPREASVDSLRRITCFNPYGQKLVDARVVRESPGSQELSWVEGAEYGTTGQEAWFLRHVYWPSATSTFEPSGLLACVITDPEAEPPQDPEAPPFDGTGSIEGYAPCLSNGRHLEYEYSWNVGGESGTIGITSSLGQGRNGSDPMAAVVRVVRQDAGYRKRALTRRLWQYAAPMTYYETRFDYGSGHAEDPLALAAYTKVDPAVSTLRNGSGAPTSESFYEDRLGMLRWMKDEAGRVEYREYDGLTGLTYAVVRDINTAAAHPGLTPGTVPAGFGSTGADRIDAVSTYAYDALGRPIAFDTPAGVADNNTTQLRRTERLVYVSLKGPSGKLSADRPAVLAYPHVSAGAPKGEISIEVSTPGGRSEAVAKAFLPAGTEPYFFLDHWTWDTPVERLDQVFAPANRILLERTEYTYSHDPGDDHLVVTESVWTEPESQFPNPDFETERHHDAQGRASKVIGRRSSGAAGFREFQKTTHDPLGRPVAWSVGSDDLHLNVTRRAAYDGGVPGGAQVVGDGHVTRTIEYSGEAGSPDRHTRHDFDWRGLPTATWHGYDPVSQTAILIESSPSYVPDEPVDGYDYAGRQIVERRYAGTIASNNLVAQSETFYDELGRVYETRSYGVEAGGVVVGTPGAPPGSPIPLTTRSWYDARGSVLKRMGPDATFRKYVYDGLGRVVKDYLAYDIAESSYADADDVGGHGPRAVRKSARQAGESPLACDLRTVPLNSVDIARGAFRDVEHLPSAGVPRPLVRRPRAERGGGLLR